MFVSYLYLNIYNYNFSTWLSILAEGAEENEIDYSLLA